jgi:hypothetical protein
VPSSPQAQRTARELSEEFNIQPAKDGFILKKLSIYNIHKNKKFLIIANGPSVKIYHKKIKEFIEREKPITIGCNFVSGQYEPNYHIFVNKKRFLKYFSSVSSKSRLIVPSYFGKKILKENCFRDFEYVNIQKAKSSDQTVFDELSQYVVYLNVGIAGIITACQMGAKEIVVVGMDGYGGEGSKKIKYFYNENDIPDNKDVASFRYENIVNELRRVGSFLDKLGIPFYIITPTSHKVFYKNLL